MGGGEGALFWSLERPQIPTTGDRPFCPVGWPVSSLRAINHVKSVRYTYLITRIVNALALLNSSIVDLASFNFLFPKERIDKSLEYHQVITLYPFSRRILLISLGLFTLYFRMLTRLFICMSRTLSLL